MNRQHLSYYILGGAIIFFLTCLYISHSREIAELARWEEEVHKARSEHTQREATKREKPESQWTDEDNTPHPETGMYCAPLDSTEFKPGKEFNVTATFSGCFESCEGGFFSTKDSKGVPIKMQLYSEKIRELIRKGVDINKVRLEGFVTRYTDAYTNTTNGGKCSFEISGDFNTM